MALTIVRDKVFVTGDRKNVFGRITFDNSYPTGGESLTGDDLGLGLELNKVEFESTSNRIAVYNYSTSKAQLYTALGTEAANASDQSAIVVRYRAVGKGSAAAV